MYYKRDVVYFREMLDRLTIQAYTTRNSTKSKNWEGSEKNKTKIKEKNVFFCYRNNTCLFRDIPVSN